MIELGLPLFGYICCATMTDGAFLGGALITDCAGLPIEFRHTEPVMPSRLQRVLYGRVLDGYIHNDVVISSLLSSIENKPQMYVVGDPSYQSGADSFGATAVWIAEARNASAKEPGTRLDLSDEEYVLHLAPGNGPVRVRMQLRTGPVGAAQMRESSAALLLDASKTMEVLEPLRRVEEALRLLWEEQRKAQPLAA